jgi:hypothetical protein
MIQSNTLQNYNLQFKHLTSSIPHSSKLSKDVLIGAMDDPMHTGRKIRDLLHLRNSMILTHLLIDVQGDGSA